VLYQAEPLPDVANGRGRTACALGNLLIDYSTGRLALVPGRSATIFESVLLKHCRLFLRIACIGTVLGSQFAF